MPTPLDMSRRGRTCICTVSSMYVRGSVHTFPRLVPTYSGVEDIYTLTRYVCMYVCIYPGFLFRVTSPLLAGPSLVGSRRGPWKGPGWAGLSWADAPRFIYDVSATRRYGRAEKDGVLLHP